MAQTPESVSWGAPLPPRKGTYIKVLPVKPDRPVAGIVISRGLLQVETHYFDERTHPCTIKGGHCFGCDIPQKPRWNGFLALIQPPRLSTFLISLTPEAVRRNAVLSVGKDDLRGWYVRAYRVGKTARCRMEVELTQKPKAANLPVEPDIMSALLNMWGEFDTVRKRVGPESPPPQTDTLPY